MSKKRYFILSPDYSDADRMKELQEKAMFHYGQKEYEQIMTDPGFQEEVHKITFERTGQNASLLLIGITALALAQCESLFVARDWEKDDHCKFLHMLAFSHGLDIVYEPV